MRKEIKAAGEMFEKVMIAIDHSDRCADLVNAAMAVTHPRHTDVTVVNVRQVPASSARGASIAVAAPDVIAPVEEATRVLRQSGYRAKPLVRDLAQGRIADELVRVIDEVGPDLVVMGSRGLSDFASLLTSSVTFQVLAQAGCPILVAREGARIEPPRRLLLAYDESHHSRRAARVASALAKATGAEIEVVTVEQPLIAWPGAILDLGADAQRRIDRVVAQLQEDVVARGFVKVAAVGRAAAIAQVADECDSDLIVMGTRGLSRIAGAVIGSVSHEVVHLSSRSVLLVP